MPHKISRQIIFVKLNNDIPTLEWTYPSIKKTEIRPKIIGYGILLIVSSVLAIISSKYEISLDWHNKRISQMQAPLATGRSWTSGVQNKPPSVLYAFEYKT